MLPEILNAISVFHPRSLRSRCGCWVSMVVGFSLLAVQVRRNTGSKWIKHALLRVRCWMSPCVTCFSLKVTCILNSRVMLWLSSSATPCYPWIADLSGSLDRPPPFEAPVPEDSMLRRSGCWPSDEVTVDGAVPHPCCQDADIKAFDQLGPEDVLDGEVVRLSLFGIFALWRSAGEYGS